MQISIRALKYREEISPCSPEQGRCSQRALSVASPKTGGWTRCSQSRSAPGNNLHEILVL